MSGRLCAIYRCGRGNELYLYVDGKTALEELPEELLRDLGRLQPVMTLLLTPERKLARVRAEHVLAAIEEKGYFLQLPPVMQPGIFTHGE